MEKIFLETATYIVCPGSNEVSDRQAEALEKLTFDWVLNAEKYVDARFSELYKAREKARLLGLSCFESSCFERDSSPTLIIAYILGELLQEPFLTAKLVCIY